MADVYFLEILGREVSKSEFSVINFDDLQKMKLCPGHIFFLPASGGRPICLLPAGGVIDSKWIQKYREKGLKSFYYLPVIDRARIDILSSTILSLKNATNEEESYEIRAKIMRTFWSGVKERHLNWVDLSFLGMESFWALPEKFLTEFQEASLVFHERAHVIATIGAISAIGLGYVEYEFVRDLYHALYLMDLGLLEAPIPFHMLEALALEVQIPRAGTTLLIKKDASGKEAQRFLMHPLEGLRRCKDIIDNFKYPAVLSVIEKHHQYDEEGFPDGETNETFMDYEMLAVILDQIIPLRLQEKEKIKSIEEIIAEGIEKCLKGPFFSGQHWQAFGERLQHALDSQIEFKSTFEISFVDRKILINER